MVVELSQDNGPTVLEFELYGALSTEDLLKIVDQLDEEAAIQKLSIEIAAENPSAVKLPEFVSNGTDVKLDGDNAEISVYTDKSVSAGSSDSDGEEPSSNPSDSSSDSMPRLQPDGDPCAIVRFIAQHDEWLRTQEIAEAIPEHWEVSVDALGSNLWNLEDRGLVEKRPYEEDKRQNEYQITEMGEEVLEQTVEHAEDLQPI